MAASSRGFPAHFDFKPRRRLLPLHSHAFDPRKRRKVCFEHDRRVSQVTCCCPDSVTPIRSESCEKSEEWRCDSRKSSHRVRVQASPSMPFASPHSNMKQERFYPRCTPRYSGPQSRDTPPRRGVEMLKVIHGGKHGKKTCIKMNGVTLQESKGVHKNKQNQELKIPDGMKNGGRNMMLKDGLRRAHKYGEINGLKLNLEQRFATWGNMVGQELGGKNTSETGIASERIIEDDFCSRKSINMAIAQPVKAGISSWTRKHITRLNHTWMGGCGGRFKPLTFHRTPGEATWCLSQFGLGSITISTLNPPSIRVVFFTINWISVQFQESHHNVLDAPLGRWVFWFGRNKLFCRPNERKEASGRMKFLRPQVMK